MFGFKIDILTRLENDLQECQGQLYLHRIEHARVGQMVKMYEEREQLLLEMKQKLKSTDKKG